jgi:hypothetical protein
MDVLTMERAAGEPTVPGKGAADEEPTDAEATDMGETDTEETVGGMAVLGPTVYGMLPGTMRRHRYLSTLPRELPQASRQRRPLRFSVSPVN